MKNSEVKDIIISYLENKIIFSKINGKINIISRNNRYDIFFISNDIGNKKHISISNDDLLKYYRFLKHK